MAFYLQGAEHSLQLSNVTNLYKAHTGPHCKIVPLLYPAHRTYRITPFQSEQLLNTPSASIPQVHIATKSHCQNIIGTPINQVKI